MGHGRARPGTAQTCASQPHIESTRAWCGWERCHAAHAPASHPRAQTRKRAPQSRRYRAFPWAGEPNQTHTGTEGDPGNWEGRRCGPLSAQIGHDRCEQTVPAGTVCGRYLHILWAKQRGYHHDSTQISPPRAAPLKSVFRSVRILARAHPANTLQSASAALTNCCKKMHGTKWKMGADLFLSLGSRLKSPRCKFGALAPAPARRRINSWKNGVDTRLCP